MPEVPVVFLCVFWLLTKLSRCFSNNLRQCGPIRFRKITEDLLQSPYPDNILWDAFGINPGVVVGDLYTSELFIYAYDFLSSRSPQIFHVRIYISSYHLIYYIN